MKPWIHEEILKTWTDAQKRLWESLCAAVPFQPPAGVEAWRETYLKNLASWEAAIKRTLEKEAAWVEEWVRRVAREKGTPEMMTTWVQQMEEVLHRWIQTQTQWWDDYFAVLRQGGFTNADQGGAQPAVVPAEPAPTSAKPPTATALPVAPISPSVVAEPVTFTAEATAPEPAPVTPTPSVESAAIPDDLKLISGIGPALEKKLHACGVASFRDLATLSGADVERIEAIIKFAGRIHREDWIGQARTQHFQKYQEQL
jgi:predicted flap endonuclease-1-like 5' DNA nuclease